MSIVVKIELTFDDREKFEEAMKHELIQGNLSDFLFAEICQNHGLGMLTRLTVEEIDD